MSTVKFKIKTPTMSSEYNGELVEGFAHMLCYIGDRAAREKALCAAQHTHANLCKWEDENTAKGAPQ